MRLPCLEISKQYRPLNTSPHIACKPNHQPACLTPFSCSLQAALWYPGRKGIRGGSLSGTSNSSILENVFLDSWHPLVHANHQHFKTPHIWTRVSSMQCPDYPDATAATPLFVNHTANGIVGPVRNQVRTLHSGCGQHGEERCMAHCPTTWRTQHEHGCACRLVAPATCRPQQVSSNLWCCDSSSWISATLSRLQIPPS